MDFGHQDGDLADDLSHVFDGRNGFVLESLTPSSWWERIQTFQDASVLIEEDRNEWQIDTYHVSSLDVPDPYSPPSEKTLQGSGDILDEVTIPAGQSFIYQVTGTLSDDAQPTIRSSAVTTLSLIHI